MTTCTGVSRVNAGPELEGAQPVSYTHLQKTHLANGKKLTDAQNLLATYERDLESLNQWVDSDLSLIHI